VGTLKKPPSLLFVTSNRLGDAVLSSGVLAHYVERQPGLRVTVACGTLPAPLFADLPGLERIIPIVKDKTRSRFGHWIELWNALPRHRWSTVIDLRSTFFAWTVRADTRIVSRFEKRHEHRVEELARQFGIEPPPSPKLFVARDRQARMDKLVDPRPILAVGPTANWGGKQWPAERFAETVRRLTGPRGILPGARVAVFGAAHEREAALAVLAAADEPLDLIGSTDLLNVFALLRRCSLFIGNDSGLMHMAAAAGIPTLGLFGPSAEWRYRPWGERTAVARTKETLEELTGAPDYDYRSHKSLMLSLTVDQVVSAAEDLWHRCGALVRP
jgi:ADP-heptose:LPS heptosyltransferase